MCEVLRTGGCTSTHGRSEAGIRSHRDSVKLSELDERLHGEIGMYLVLDNLGWDPRRAENVEEE